MIPPENALIETDLLRTFVAISETGSFAAAAKRVHRTPSAVSMQMKRLEELLGQELFEKSGRSVVINRHGEMLLGYGRQILQLSQETISRFRASPLHGQLRFGAPDDFGTRFLPDILARFSCTHPDVSVEVVLGPSVDLLEQFHAGVLDLAITTSGVGSASRASDRLVFSEPLTWFGLAGGRAKTRAPLPLALSSPGCCWRAEALDALERAGVPYRVCYTSEACAGQIAALLADLAIAPLPESLLKPEYEIIGPESGLPPLGEYQIRLIEHAASSEISDAFAAHVADSFGQLEVVQRAGRGLLRAAE